jgi:tripartite-type tricarboxylate transporter receptor subunit TctC
VRWPLKGERFLKSKSLLAACLLICTTGLVSAQNYPSKPIRYIVPFPPGGGTDIVARALAPRLLEASGITLIVDNRGGGGTVVGAEMAARSPADGYTVFMGTNTSHAINPNLPTKLPYDAVRDFQPVTRLAMVPYMITVHPSLPARNVKELVALAKARPGQLNFASSGNGTPGHLAGLMLNEAAGIDMTHIPYKGSAPALTAMVSGETQLLVSSLTSTLPLVKAGRLRPIAMSSLKRSPLMPALPTVAEGGYPGFEAITWFGLFLPANTAAAITAKLNTEFVKVLNNAEFKAWLAEQGAEAAPTTPEEFAAFIKAEIARYAPLVKKSGMKPD